MNAPQANAFLVRLFRPANGHRALCERAAIAAKALRERHASTFRAPCKLVLSATQSQKPCKRRANTARTPAPRVPSAGPTSVPRTQRRVIAHKHFASNPRTPSEHAPRERLSSASRAPRKRPSSAPPARAQQLFSEHSVCGPRTALERRACPSLAPRKRSLISPQTHCAHHTKTFSPPLCEFRASLHE